ncbi:uncharacterized protein KY384_002595 [Bacidia gigantensis]|uniref:uncharacterized protein n=1 Tax=Bacidia gigantensis TaxID=2732470 RepID=UPI001D03ABAC|nr:uncharacterized protein KY384_002595 [Bacidia gigantensis]KAG8532718.1 hypothetical protein KY384_002595 [Bacidia gigantensis]
MLESIQESQQKPELSAEVVSAVRSSRPLPSNAPVSESPPAHAPLRSSESSSSTVPLSSLESDRSTTQTLGSETSVEISESHVIRGFAPNQISSSYRSKTNLAPSPVPVKTTAHPLKTTQPNFMLGGSSDDAESSFEDRMPSHSKQSSLTIGLKKPMAAKKQLSFKDELAKRTSYEDEKVFVSDDEDSSAIDSDSDSEDDDGEWEDDGSEDADTTIDDRPTFQRVDSKPDLVSRRSLLTTQLNEGDRQADFAAQAQAQSLNALRKTKTQTCLDPRENSDILQMPQSKRAKPISMTSQHAQSTPIALSPRSTRRNMLATEMTESLRKAVLFERQQKKATANAVLQRRHTTQDLTHMRNYPEGEEGGMANHSWNDDYSTGGFSDYHQTGW